MCNCQVARQQYRLARQRATPRLHMGPNGRGGGTPCVPFREKLISLYRQFGDDEMHAKPAIAAVVSMVLVLGGWRAPGDACSLLTQAEVSSVVGIMLSARPNGASVCAWTEPPGPTFANKRVEVTVIKPEAFDVGKTPVGKMTKTPVSGIGDDAYYAEGFGMATLSVKKGGAAFVINVKSRAWSTDQTKAMEKALAEKALARL
jgi:hypothetical protein